MIGASNVALAVLLGGGIGLGVWTLLMLLPRWTALSLTRRIAPYVRDVTDPAGVSAWGEATLDPGGAVTHGVRSVWIDVRGRIGALVGGGEAIARRMRAAGLVDDVAAYRAKQVTVAAIAAGVGGVSAIALSFNNNFSIATLALPIVTAICGWMTCDVRLSSQAKARAVRLEEEVPTVLEFVALCLAAGEAISDSIERVSRGAEGDLAKELRRAVLAARTGSTLPEALTDMAARLQVPSLTRAVDHLVAGIDRGAPLAAILQDQAADAREHAKQSLIELAGRKEILMLLPLVFGLLPLSVLFAIFPGVLMLRLGIG